MTITQLQSDHPDLLNRAANCLDGGGVIVVPTDTVYGLAVLPDRKQSIERLFAIKARPANVNLPIMVADIEQLQGLGAQLNEDAMALLTSSLVPGALTLALGVNQAKAPQWLRGRDEIAIRIPDDPFLLQLMRRVGPILATSANRHGNPTPNQLDAVLEDLALPPDLAIDGGSIDTVPSTLVNCNCEPAKIERLGVISADSIGAIVNV